MNPPKSNELQNPANEMADKHLKGDLTLKIILNTLLFEAKKLACFFSLTIFAIMLKKLFAFTVLLAHINYAMFIPQLEETDSFDDMGVQVDDINSFSEFVDEVVLGNKDTTPEDEDNDNGFWLNTVKAEQYCFEQITVEVMKPGEDTGSNREYPVFKLGKLKPIYRELICPPPEKA